MSMSETLRRTIRKHGLTTYRIAVDTGLGRVALDRFLAGTSLRLDKADVLAEYLGLALRPVKRPRSGGAGSRARKDGQRRGKSGT